MNYYVEKLMYNLTCIEDVLILNMENRDLRPFNNDVENILKTIKLQEVVYEFTSTVLLINAVSGVGIKDIAKIYNISLDEHWSKLKFRPDGFAHNFIRNLIEILIELNIDNSINFYFIDNMYKISIKYKNDNEAIFKYGFLIEAMNNTQDNNTSKAVKYTADEIIVSFNKDLLYKSRDGYAITIEERDRLLEKHGLTELFKEARLERETDGWIKQREFALRTISSDMPPVEAIRLYKELF